MSGRPVLVLGASGYVGSRLVPWLVARGFLVRAAARSLESLSRRPWARHSRVALAEADALDPESLRRAFDGCAAAYYLVHSMGSEPGGFVEADRRAAEAAAEAAGAAGTERILYLGGLGEGPRLSPHLASRQEVGRILKAGRAKVTELRAAMILGSGSASFEILRYLVERLPLMVTPRWVRTSCQPISIRNVLEYLGRCLELPETAGGLYEIGGPDVTDYLRLMRIYGEEAGLPRRLILPVPVFTPKLSSYWIHGVTPVSGRLARPLAEGLSHPVVCRDDEIRRLIPQKLEDCRQAIRGCLAWRRAALFPPQEPPEGMPAAEWPAPGDPRWAGGTLYEDSRSVEVAAECSDAWKPISLLGGADGWYHSQWLWRLRGRLDRLVGGPGRTPARPKDGPLRSGGYLDGWSVKEVIPGRRLLLAARMKLPGEASLDFRVEPVSDRRSRIRLIARFAPRGLGGLVYWWAVRPLHAWVFGGMIRQIARRAAETARGGNDT